MSSSRKLVRQLSLQCETPKLQQRKGSLRKQLSEDRPDILQNCLEPELNIRISLSAKNRTKNLDRPPPVKVAWGENGQKSPRDLTPKKHEGIVAKKCAENKRPNSTPPKIVKQTSLEKDSILYSRQELAVRLKQAWKDREKTKQNLNIFLAHNTNEKEEDFYHEAPITDRTASENKISEKCIEPKIILPLKPEILNSENNVKSVFQKHIRKAMKQNSNYTENCYSPTRTIDRNNENRCTTIVVPIVNKSATPPLVRCESANKSKQLVRQGTTEKNEKEKSTKDPETNPSNIEETQAVEPDSDNKPIISNVIIRPSTAASKREMFQKRTNSAFQGSVKKENTFRPPLVRASSVPTKQEPPKPKFLATKRRVKTAKAKIKIGKMNDQSDEDTDGSSRKCLQRCVSVAGEVVTMISLISPEGSDNEERLEDDKEKIKSEACSPVKQKVLEEKLQNKSDQKNFSLRKTVKSVSFQQSSIHAVRSFSASFPARRGSVATALMLGNKSTNKLNNNVPKIQEKRAPVNILEDEERVPKRRLVRTKSAPLQRSTENEDSAEPTLQAEPDEITPACNDALSVSIETDKSKESTNVEKDEIASLEEEDELADTTPKFDNPKEKQCWDMYCRMSEKGVTISFDTILRGMLTPTEYRLRRKPSLVPEDNCEITEN